MKIPKEIVKKIRQANEINNEICKWIDENLDCEGMDLSRFFWDIVPEPQGIAQDNNGEEYCNQSILGEDWFIGEYYWQLEGESNYLQVDFEIW